VIGHARRAGKTIPPITVGGNRRIVGRFKSASYQKYRKPDQKMQEIKNLKKSLAQSSDFWNPHIVTSTRHATSQSGIPAFRQSGIPAVRHSGVIL
jgi:hypothetical protein